MTNVSSHGIQLCQSNSDSRRLAPSLPSIDVGSEALLRCVGVCRVCVCGMCSMLVCVGCVACVACVECVPGSVCNLCRLGKGANGE